MGDRLEAALEAGVLAEALAARLAAHGYQAWFPPGRDDGQVCVTDDGGLTWIRGHQAETAATASGPDSCGQATPDVVPGHGDESAEAG